MIEVEEFIRAEFAKHLSATFLADVELLVSVEGANEQNINYIVVSTSTSEEAPATSGVMRLQIQLEMVLGVEEAKARLRVAEFRDGWVAMLGALSGQTAPGVVIKYGAIRVYQVMGSSTPASAIDGNKWLINGVLSVVAQYSIE